MMSDDSWSPDGVTGDFVIFVFSDDISKNSFAVRPSVPVYLTL
jgi:hypothetical protein